MGTKLHPRLIKILKASLSVITLLLLVYVLLKASIILFPFLIAFLITLALEPVVNFLNKKLRINRKISILATLILFLSTIGVTLFFAITKLLTEISDVSKNLRILYTSNQDNIAIQIQQFKDFYDNSLSEQNRKTIESNLEELSGNLISVAESVLENLLNFANSIPGFLVSILVVILATYFILSDKEKIRTFIIEQTPKAWLDKTKYLIDNIFLAVIQYLKAQAILISITFIVVLTGFFIIDIKYALLIAFLVSLVDALPVVGIGSTFVPWIIYQFIFGNTQTAIGLLILYFVVIIIRQIMEPKIYGRQMEIHPLVALIAMYIGFEYFGILGLVLSPIIVMVSKNILSEAIRSHKLKELFDPDLGSKASSDRDPDSKFNPSPTSDGTSDF